MKVPRPVKYGWSRTEGPETLNNPPVPADRYAVGDIFLHEAAGQLQFWVCHGTSRGNKFWKVGKTSVVSPGVAESTSWPGREKPFFLSYNSAAKRPSWVLRSTVTTRAGRKQKGQV